MERFVVTPCNDFLLMSWGGSEKNCWFQLQRTSGWNQRFFLEPPQLISRLSLHGVTANLTTCISNFHHAKFQILLMKYIGVMSTDIHQYSPSWIGCCLLITQQKWDVFSKLKSQHLNLICLSSRCYTVRYCYSIVKHKTAGLVWS